MKDLAHKIGEVEKRVRALVDENRVLRSRVDEMGKELARARQDVQHAEAAQGKQRQVREKIERVLMSLEALERKE